MMKIRLHSSLMPAINLALNWKLTSVPQAKGRVERLNPTLQLRLVVELRLAGISTIEEANEFLNSYIKEFNALFSLPIHHTKTVFEKQPSNHKINIRLAVLSSRKLDGGNCIRYKNKYYIPITRNVFKTYLKEGMITMVIEANDKTFYINILNQLFGLEEIPFRESKSKTLDIIESKIKKNLYTSNVSPLEARFFAKLSAKQKHRLGANV